MTKRYKNKCRSMSEAYWQSDAINQRTMWLYMNWLISNALSRFEWEGLPDSCDARYLEWTLLNNGTATISKPTSGKLKVWTSTQAVTNGRPNIYDNPVSWDSFGNNGWRYPVTPKNGVLVWDNLARMPIFGDLELFARRMANAERVCDVNVYAQRTPVVYAVDQSKRQDVINVLKQVDGFEPAVVGTDSLRDIVDQIKALKVDAPFVADVVKDYQQKLWVEANMYLGIETMPYKGERMIESEVTNVTQPIEIRRASFQRAREEAVDKLNRRFGLSVRVKWTEYKSLPLGSFSAGGYHE